MDGIGEYGWIVGVDFAHRHNSLVHLLLYDIIISQLFPQHSHLSLQPTHLILTISLCLVELPFEQIEFLPQHIILMLMNIEIT